MLLIMIFTTWTYILPDGTKAWLQKPLNENPQLSYIKPLNANCRLIKDTSDSFIKNDTYKCGN